MEAIATEACNARIRAPNGGILASVEMITLDCWRDMAAITADFIMHDPGGIARFDHYGVANAHVFWKDLDITTEPYAGVPGIELLQKQMVAVLSQLRECQSPLTAIISGIRTDPSENGKKIATAMGIVPNNTQQAVQQAIIQSLLTPHRQIGLPTCNMDAIIIAESLDYPERQAELYRDIMTVEHPNTVPFPANNRTRERRLQLAPILSHWPTSRSREECFVTIKPAAASALDNAQYLLNCGKRTRWDSIGITAAGAIRRRHAADGVTIINYCDEFNYPIRDVTDAFYAMLMQQVYTTNTADSKSPATYITASTAFIMARYLYYGFSGCGHIDYTNALSAIPAHSQLFAHYDLVTFAKYLAEKPGNIATFFSQPELLPEAGTNRTQISGTQVYLDGVGGHIENFFLEKMRRLEAILPTLPVPAALEPRLPIRPPLVIPKLLGRAPPLGRRPAQPPVRPLLAAASSIAAPIDVGTSKLLTDNEVCIIGDRNYLRNGKPVYLGIIRVQISPKRYRLVELVKGNDGWQAYHCRTGWLAAYDS
ncbi:MAG: hypothetical protein LBF24_03190 [Puniceicoccales bacterium]|jgi:hypothetical protein|nr:hypothetical protein [Puniceicoccales bacterium]